MSGIAGIIYPDVFQGSYLITPMLDVMAHRGTHQERDVATTNHLQLGVIGSNLSRTLFGIAGVDGEIHNYPQLKIVLRSKGHPIKTEDHAEIILYAYKE